MQQQAQKIDQEYWRPTTVAKPELHSSAHPLADTCSGCGSEFIIGARYCHVCGAGRQDAPGSSLRWLELLDFDRIRHGLGLSAASLVAFIFGMAAVLAALCVGFIYSANTLVDWQAVQTWRIEWMLAAVVAFAAGILLKKTE